MNAAIQLSLFDLQAIYRDNSGEPVSNEQVYSLLARSKGVERIAFDQKLPIGKSACPHSPLKRKVRWYQQTLKHLGVIEQTGRGLWRLSQEEGSLHVIPAKLSLLAFSTDLGIALWSNASIFKSLNEPIHLCITSPPYPLKKARQYGNVEEAKWVKFLCASLEPIVRNMVAGGSLVLNVTNDIFESKSPARSLYLERLILALHDNLGLHLMDRIPWINDSKPPAPTYWACVKRYQLATSWEPVLWFTNDPVRVRSDNRRVLQPHTEKHQKFLAEGGNKRVAEYGDGAYKLRPGSFSRQTEGKIPKNRLALGHRCKDTLAIRNEAKLKGLPPHPAMFPTTLPEFFIRFLTAENELVVDPFAGSFKTCLAAERLGRRWIGTERVLEYVEQANGVFCNSPH